MSKISKVAKVQVHEARAPLSGDTALLRQEVAAQKPLKGVGMKFHVRVGEKLNKLLGLAHAACANGRDGTFEFPWGDGKIGGLATYHAAKDGVVTEAGIVIHLGDFSIHLPDKGATATHRRMRVLANVTLCYGRTLGAVVVHLCDFADAMTAELEEGQLYFTDPAMKLPEFDDDQPHVETACFDRMLRTETTPRYYLSESFARSLAELACRA